MINFYDKKWVNEEPFSHTSSNGTTFTADRCDFQGGVRITKGKISIEKYTVDVAEMIAYHVTWIRPKLNGFQGYDAIQYVII